MTSLGIISSFIHILSFVLIAAIIVRALMSWFMPNDGTGLTRVLNDITDPILVPIRRVLPPVGGIDFSPLLALIAIQLLSTLIISVLPAGA